MIKTSLPVIILKGSVLLPYSELKLEIDNINDKNILNISNNDYDNHILIISPTNPIEQMIDIKSLPTIGIVAKLTTRIDLGNTTRIIMEGINRVNIDKYKEENDLLYAVITSTTQFAMSPSDESALIKKLNYRIEQLINKNPKMSNSILSQISNVNSISKISDIVSNYLTLDFERRLEYLSEVNPYKRLIMIFEDIKTEEEIIELDNKIEDKLKDKLDNNQKEYILREKIKLIKEELGEINVKDDEVELLYEKTNKLKCSTKIKDKIYSEIKRYELINNNSPEISNIRNYIDLMLSLPWNVFTKENKNLTIVKDRLDKTHYGLTKAKERIIEYIAVKQLSNSVNTPILCLVGPPGVGKTSLAKSIANSIDRKFIKISVGGISDESEIIGHRRAYIGSSPGKIINAMKKAKVSNPVILIDEIDKMTKDFKGDPASTLLDILDKEQNKYFVDSYVEEEYDLSNVIFILTANYLYQIPEALRDRLEIIDISGYTEYEKLDIAKKYLIKDLIDENGLDSTNISISDNAIMNIIRNYTKEAGIRDLKRNIDSILRKIAREIVENNTYDKVYKINDKNIVKYLGKRKYFDDEVNSLEISGIANGMAYTEYGGTLLPIEVLYYKGKGNLILTGSLGEVLKESAEISLSYIKKNHSKFGIDYKALTDSDIHIHLPEGAVPKDGPSAGITLTSALISAFSNKPIPNNYGMTGEITLSGKVIPIGGLKEKIIGAKRNGINKIIIPYKNECDLDEVPKEVKDGIDFILVNDYIDVYNELFKN